MPSHDTGTKEAMRVRFWGVRGSIPTSGSATSRTGGNTACVEVSCGGHVLLFDAGSGLVPAGLALEREGVSSCDLFLSHSHYDHLIGLPFFRLLSSPEGRCTIWSGHLAGETETRSLISDFLRTPYFPVPIDSYAATIAFRDFRPGETLNPQAGIMIETAALRHPGGVVAYAVRHAGRKAVYVTDCEHGSDECDAMLLRLAQGADLLIFDAMYTEEELQRHRGFGHSTWQEAVRVARQAGVRRLALFHHAPLRSDDEIDMVERLASGQFSNTVAARDGLVLSL
jgi:phosphoribosyl 1,2-cyclic phosphodiesterase